MHRSSGPKITNRLKLNEDKELCQLYENGHDVHLLSIILGAQGFVLTCFPQAMTALWVSEDGQLTLAGALSDFALLVLPSHENH